MNSFGGEKSVLMDEIARRQRKLIPLNIVVAIIALVAAVSLLFAPIVSVDAVGLGDYITEMMGEQTSGGDSSEEGPTIDTAKIVSTVTSNMGNVSLTTMSLATIAFSDDLTETLKDYVSEIGSETLKKSEKELITDVAVPMMVEMMEEESGEEAPDNIKNIDADAIYDKAKALETASAGEVDETISALVEELQNQLGEDYISDENLADLESSIRTIYDDTVAATDGTFTIESCICVFVSKSLQESGEITQTFTSYADLIDYFMDSSSELDDTIAQVDTLPVCVPASVCKKQAVYYVVCKAVRVPALPDIRRGSPRCRCNSSRNGRRRRNCGDSGNDIYDDLDKRRLLHTALDYFDILGIPHQAQNTRIQQAA